MKRTLSQVCSLESAFEQDIEDYAAGGCRTIELWLGKLETFLQTHSVDDVRKLLDVQEMIAPVASYQGGILASQGEKRKQHWDDFQKRLELCQSLAVETLVVAADIIGPFDQQTLDRVNASLVEAAQKAAGCNIRLAIEFQSRSGFINNLQTAAAVVEELGSPHLGICLDAFHYHTGPSKSEDLAYLTADNLFHVQLCDLADCAREFATDADRILPGDGDIGLLPIVERLAEIGYSHAVSIEVMNPQIWQVQFRLANSAKSRCWRWANCSVSPRLTEQAGQRHAPCNRQSLPDPKRRTPR